MVKLSHIDESNRPTMVDVSGKVASVRTAHARAELRVPPVLAEGFAAGTLRTKKGPVFDTASIAGVMAAKRTHELIPFCHPLALEHCHVELAFESPDRVLVDCRVRLTGKTGVEMEALTGASVAALTVYDMCKGLSHDIEIVRVRLMEKRGGKSDYAVQKDEP